MTYSSLACLGPHSAELCTNPGCRRAGCQGRMPAVGSLDRDFDETLRRFAADLASKQEPLGKEFSEVLYENLWDLYVRS